MAIYKINLLPAQYLDRRKVPVAWAVVSAVIVLELVGLMFANMTLARQRTELNTSVTEKTARLQDLTNTKQQAGQITERVKVYDPPIAFMKELESFNRKRPDLYERTARYVYSNAMAVSMESTSNQLSMQVYVSNMRDLARTFLYLHNQPDFTGVALNTVPVFKPLWARRARPRPVRPDADIPVSDFSQLGSPGGGDMGLGSGAPGMGADPGMGGSGAPMMGGSGAPMMGGSGAPMMGGAGGPPMGASSYRPSGGMGSGMPQGGSGGMTGMRPGGMGGMGGGSGGGSAGGDGGGGGNAEIPAYLAQLLSDIDPVSGAVVRFTCALRTPIVRPGGAGGGGGGAGGSGGMEIPGMGGTGGGGAAAPGSGQ